MSKDSNKEEKEVIEAQDIQPPVGDLSEKITTQVTSQISKIVQEVLNAHDSNHNQIQAFEESLNKDREVRAEIAKKTFKKLLYYITGAVIMVALVTWGISYRFTLEARQMTVETQRQIQVVVNMANAEVMIANIEDTLHKIIRKHKAAALMSGRRWRDYTPSMVQDMAREILVAFRLRNVLPEEIYAIAGSETGWRFWATSVDGAQGLLQMMPETQDAVCKRWRLGKLDPFNPAHNIRMAAIHIQDLKVAGNSYYKKYKGKEGWIISDTAGSWNGGLGYYSRWLISAANGKRKPIYEETGFFIKKVKFYFKNYTQKDPDYSVVWYKGMKK
jgi:hypothetical protein